MAIPHILILEDSPEITQSLQDSFSSLSARTIVAATLSEAFELLETITPAVAVLDRMLPDGDGMEVASYLIDSMAPTRILMLSKLGAVEDRVAGFEAGIDDYLPKPFSAAECKLRVARLLSVQKSPESKHIKLGSLLIDAAAGLVHTKTNQISLRRREIQILTCLGRYKNQVVSRDQIISHVWGVSEELPTYTTLDVYIRRVRVALGEWSKLITTVRGFGYMAVDGK